MLLLVEILRVAQKPESEREIVEIIHVWRGGASKLTVDIMNFFTTANLRIFTPYVIFLQLEKKILQLEGVKTFSPIV